MASPLDVKVKVALFPKEDFDIEPSPMGRGAFGCVQRAFHRDRNEQCAIKCLFPMGSSNSHVQRQLASEAERMVSARHENLMTLYGLLTNMDEICGLVMPLLRYGSLDIMWKNLKRQVELPLRLRFVRETADGMNYLHTLQSKILHMDLKPGNILLNDDLHVKITDFGLSKMRGLVEAEQQHVGGTPAFMAPEHTTDSSLQPSTKSDVFSYGVTVFCILSQERPYKDSYGINRRVVAGERPDLNDIPMPVRGARWWDQIQRLMTSCWSPSPDQRQDFKDFVGSLHRLTCQKKELKDSVFNTLKILNDARSDMSQLADGIQGVNMNSSQQSHISQQVDEDQSVGRSDFTEVLIPEAQDRQNDSFMTSSSSSPSSPQMPGGFGGQMIFNIAGNENVNIGTHFHMSGHNRPAMPTILKPHAVVTDNLMWRLSQTLQQQKGDGYKFFKKLGLSKESILEIYEREKTRNTDQKKIIRILLREWRHQQGSHATRHTLCQAAIDSKRDDLMQHFYVPDQ